MPKSKSTSPTKKRSAHKFKLPSNFVPGKYTVLCGRGKLCSESPGNKHLRSLVAAFLTPYSMAKSKSEKSAIVSAIIHYIRQASPYDGIFVKEDEASGGQREWWEVDESFAREKIGCIFRDVLHTQYKSSTKAKHARKMREENPSLCQEREGQTLQHQQDLAVKSALTSESFLLTQSMNVQPASGLKMFAKQEDALMKVLKTAQQQQNRHHLQEHRSDFFPFPQFYPVDPHQQQKKLRNTTSTDPAPSSCKTTATFEQSTLSTVQVACQIISMDDDIILDLPAAEDLSSIFD